MISISGAKKYNRSEKKKIYFSAYFNIGIFAFFFCFVAVSVLTGINDSSTAFVEYSSYEGDL